MVAFAADADTFAGADVTLAEKVQDMLAQILSKVGGIKNPPSLEALRDITSGMTLSIFLFFLAVVLYPVAHFRSLMRTPSNSWEYESAEGLVISVTELIANTIVQLLPLILIKKKIVLVDAKVSVLCTFVTKVLVMHLSLFVLRVLSFFTLDTGEFMVDLIGASILVVILQNAFELHWPKLLTEEYRDVHILHLAALVFTVFMGYFYGTSSWNMNDFMIRLNNALEVMTFMPAVWTLYKMNRNVEVFTPMSAGDSANQAKCFLAFVFAFYVHENIYVVVHTEDQPLCWIAHCLHCFLLLDFGAFFLFQTQNPKERNEDVF